MTVDGIQLAVGVVAAIALAWWASRAATRRRVARFEAIARSFGSEMVYEDEFLQRFKTRVSGREVDVRYQYLPIGRHLITTIPLRNVADIHSADIWPNLSVREYGYPFRDGWLDERTRAALAAFFAQQLRVEKLVIEKGALLHRSGLSLQRLEGRLKELITRQVAVAEALERTV